MKVRGLLVLLVSVFFSVAGHASDFPAKEIYMKYSPSVVLIKASKEGGQGSVGTGSIFAKDGLVITNAHVVISREDNKPFPKLGVFMKPAGAVFPTATELNRYYEAEVLKYDNQLDLAVLKVRNLPEKVEIVEFADPGEILPGEEVIAIGHPEMGGFWTLTYGRISGEKKNFQGLDGKDMFQTDTSVNRGNSGGPLLDRRGYMVAVNSNIARQAKDGLAITGVNFAIKSSVAKKWLDGNGFHVAYGQRPLVEEQKVTSLAPEQKQAIEPVGGPAPTSSPIPSLLPVIRAKQTGAVRDSREIEGQEADLPDGGVGNKRFETPMRPYDYDDFLKAAERDLEDMMDEMKEKFKR